MDCQQEYVSESDNILDAFQKNITLGQCPNNHIWIMKSSNSRLGFIDSIRVMYEKGRMYNIWRRI